MGTQAPVIFGSVVTFTPLLMEFSEQVLIIQLGQFKEADLWVRLLSPTRGLLSAFAFGGSKSRRRFTGCLDVFNEVNVHIKSGKQGEYLALQEGVLIKGPLRLREDWRRFGMASNCIKFLQSFGVGPDGASKAHALVLQTLRLLEEADILPLQLPLFFRVRLAFDQGYALEMTRCGLCSAPLEGRGAWLALERGVLYCSVCRFEIKDESRRFVFLDAGGLDVLASVKNDSPLEWAGLKVSGANLAVAARAMDSFVQYHVGLSWENGRFRRV